MPRQFNPLTLIALIAVLSLFVMTAVVAIVGNIQPDSPISQIEVLAQTTMDDGTILTVNKVTFGQHHQIDVLVPSRYADPFDSGFRKESADTHSSGDHITVWMTRQHPQSGRHLDFDWWLHSTVTDQWGEEHRDDDARYFMYSGRGSSSSGSNRPFRSDDSRHLSDESAVILVCSHFPLIRSDGPVPLKIYNADGEEVAALEIPNPTPQPAEEWTPDELPVTRTNGDVELTLNHFRTRLQKGQRHTEQGVQEYVYASFDHGQNDHWAITVGGRKNDDWRTGGFDLSDALGRRSSNWRIELSQNEPVWKVVTKVYRKVSAEFDDSEMIRFDPITIPEEGQVDTSASVIKGKVGDAQVRVLAGAGKVSYRLSISGLGNYSGNRNGTHHSQIGLKTANGRQSRRYKYSFEQQSRGGQCRFDVNCDLPHVLLDFPSQTAGLHRDLRAVDDQGRKVGLSPVNIHGFGSVVFLETKDGAKDVRIEALFQTPLEFEFFVKPPEPTPLPKESK